MASATKKARLDVSDRLMLFPNEILIMICQNLPLDDLIRFSHTNSKLFNLISDETKLWSSALKKYLSEESQLRQLALEISNHKSSILGTQFEKINALIHVHTQKNWLSHNPKLVVHEPLNIKKSSEEVGVYNHSPSRIIAQAYFEFPGVVRMMIFDSLNHPKEWKVLPLKINKLLEIKRCRVEHLHVYRSVIIADIRCKDQLITLGFDLKVESNEPEIIWKNTWKREDTEGFLVQRTSNSSYHFDWFDFEDTNSLSLRMTCVMTGLYLKEFHFENVEYLPQVFTKTADDCVLVAKVDKENGIFDFHFANLITGAVMKFAVECPNWNIHNSIYKNGHLMLVGGNNQKVYGVIIFNLQAKTHKVYKIHTTEGSIQNLNPVDDTFELMTKYLVQKCQFGTIVKTEERVSDYPDYLSLWKHEVPFAYQVENHTLTCPAYSLTKNPDLIKIYDHATPENFLE